MSRTIETECSGVDVNDANANCECKKTMISFKCVEGWKCGVSNYMQEHFVQREVGYYCVIGV